jgi:hypothetical protein
MEKLVFDFLLDTYVLFHRSIGLLVMIILVLWMMSGRRLESRSYTNAFLKTFSWVCKKSGRILGIAAKETAAKIPAKHAGWRPFVHACAMCGYCTFAVAIAMLVVTQCAQPPH